MRLVGRRKRLVESIGESLRLMENNSDLLFENLKKSENETGGHGNLQHLNGDW